jgi:PAS domain S-box-containing protein
MKKQQILIIDDDSNIRKTLSDILKVKGYEPLIAKNGTEGLELLRRSSVNLVLIDLGLPDMSGIEVLGRVKAAHPATEAIILTGQASLDSAIEATNKGAFSYLLKPYEIDQLMLHIRHALEKHETEEELIQIHKAVESSGEAIGMSTPQGNHFYQNKAFLDLFEYSVEELNQPSAPFVIYVDPEVGREVFETIMRGDPWMGETIMVAKSGRRFPVFLRADAVKDCNGAIIGLIGIHTDITERKQAEEALRESEEKYRAFFETSGDCVFITSREGSWIDFNDVAVQFFGYESRVDLQRAKIQDLYLNEQDRARVTQEIVQQGFARDCAVDLRKKDGSIIHTLITAVAKKDNNGQVIGYQGTIKDVTDKRRAEEELAATYEELRKKQAMIIEREKMASIGVLAAGIAHEIKNPLSIILQGINYLQTTVTDNSLMAEVIERLNKAILRADEIVKGLISYSRQNPLFLTEQDIPALIDESLVLTENEFRKKNLRVVRQYAPDLPKVAADGNQIKQVFVNVLMNGIDAMSRNGTFTIAVRKIEDDKGNNALQISFKDTGQGIPADKINNIFDPFYTTKVVGNTGLGLSISRGIIDKHKGIIYAENKNEQGANIIIELPIPL